MTRGRDETAGTITAWRVRAEKAEARVADLERTAQCAEDMRDASDARVAELEQALAALEKSTAESVDRGVYELAVTHVAELRKEMNRASHRLRNGVFSGRVAEELDIASADSVGEEKRDDVQSCDGAPDAVRDTSGASNAGGQIDRLSTAQNLNEWVGTGPAVYAAPVPRTSEAMHKEPKR